MKQLFLVLLLFSATTLFGQGILEIKKPEINLKNLKANDQPFTQVYQLKNTGKQPVILTRVSPMTSMLKADWTKEPIAPGKTGEIRITFTPTQLPENFNFRILLYSNAQNNRQELTLSGNITDNPDKPYLLYKYDLDGLKFKTTNINLNKVFTWEVKSDTVYYYNTRQETINMGIRYKPSHINAVFTPAKVEPGKKAAIIITYNAPQKNDYGYNYESLVLSINNSRDYKYRLTITANLVEDFSKLSKKELTHAPVASFDKKEISFGNIKPGEKANCDFVLTNTGKSTLFIRKTKASCGCTAVTLGEKTLEAGKSTTIRATFDSTGKSGRQIKSISVITNDPTNPEINLTIDGNIGNK